jgi:CRP-like cAMP-binding protein
MVTKLGQAKAQVRSLVAAGDYPRALRLLERLLTAAPLDHELRLHVGDVLAKIGLADEARVVYQAVGAYDVVAGHPLSAVVASHALDALGAPAPELLEEVARTYASGSASLTRFATRAAPVDPEMPVDVEGLTEQPFDDLVAAVQARAADFTSVEAPRPEHHPLAFLSELDAKSMLAVLLTVQVRRLEDGELVVRQGDAGTSLFLLAAGELRVVVTTPEGAEREVARLYENTLFGEMALITGTPRAASVAAVGAADVLEVSVQALAGVAAEIPGIAAELDRFARERLIKNLLATSPLFTPFTKDQQTELLRRFEGVEVGAGTEVIRENEAGLGLYVVLSGELEASRRAPGGDAVVLGRLSTGDIFGEMSLITRQPTSATVRALGKCMLLFLDRTYVERLAAAIPEISAYFSGVASRRAQGNTQRLGASPVPGDAVELDPADVLLL